MKKTPNSQNRKLSALCKRYSNFIADLFPETLPPVPPALWPTKGTRADEALQALITGPQNQADYSGTGWRLAADVKALQYKGWSIIRRDIAHRNCRALIAEYRLDRADQGTAAALTAKGVQ